MHSSRQRPEIPIPAPDAQHSDTREVADKGATAGTDTLIQSVGQELVGGLTDTNQTAYVWDIAKDRITWEENALEVLGLPVGTDISTGSDFHQLIAPEHIARRTETILSGEAEDRVRGVPYRVQYRVQPAGPRGKVGVWIEDYGRWWPNTAGAATYARGSVRVVGDEYVKTQRQSYSSDVDELTGQLTRVRLMETLSATINLAKRKNSSCVFMVASVNNLAVINETLGFGVGDEMIAATGRVIASKLRHGDTVGRYSSNKFGIILHGYTASEMGPTAERLMSAVRGTNVFSDSCKMAVTISMGGVSFPDQVDGAAQAVNCALHALECARRIHADSFVRFEPNRMRETKRMHSIAMSDEILGALEGGRVSVALQPMVSATTGEPTYYECLARIVGRDGRAIAPSEFMPVAEKIGLARLIDRRVLELATDLLSLHSWLSLTVNVSGASTTDPDWIATLRGLFQDNPGYAGRLVVELTETAMIDDIDQALSFIDTVKELGCRVAIDDFGAGYTSFKNLKRLPVDMVKIDGSFVKNLASDKGDQAFVKAMAELAQTFGMEIVAEWVVDRESARLLRQCGITYLQGFLYGEPFPAENLLAAQATRSQSTKAAG